MFNQFSSKNIRRYRQGLLAIAILLSALVIFYPEVHPLTPWVVLAFIPIVIIISFFKREAFVLLENDAPLNKINLLGPFLFVSIALCLHAFSEYQDTNYSKNSASFQDLLIFCGVPAAIGFVIFCSIKSAKFGVAVVVAFPLSFFLTEAINSTPPFSEEVEYRGNIIRKYTSLRPVSHSIVIETAAGEVHTKTSSIEYKNYRVGDLACAKQKTGRLGWVMRWSSPCTTSNPSLKPDWRNKAAPAG